MTSLFISDLHLEPSRPDITEAFIGFCNHIAPRAQQLYILGDFFEAWIGDDESSPLQQRIEHSLRALSDKGVDIFVMPGNRDFLMGDAFARRAGVKLIPDPQQQILGGIPTLLMHGDSLCSADAEYVRFRARIRDPKRQKRLLQLPLILRRMIARLLRAISRYRNQNKPAALMDVVPSEVVRAMQEAQATRLIHGHTHRPAIHSLMLSQGPCERIVLGDWHTQGWYGALDADGRFTLHTLPLPARHTPA